MICSYDLTFSKYKFNQPSVSVSLLSNFMNVTLLLLYAVVCGKHFFIHYAFKFKVNHVVLLSFNLLCECVPVSVTG